MNLVSTVAQQEESSSPLPKPSKQRASHETRRIQELVRINLKEVTNSPNLLSAAEIILGSIDPSDPWFCISPFEMVEKFENHAEVLLSDSAFVESLGKWSGFEEIRAITADKKWWKRRKLSQRNGPTRRKVQITFGEGLDTRSGSIETTSADISQDDSPPVISIEPKRTAKKGTSALRPRLFTSGTINTPTQRSDEIQRLEIVDSEEEESDDARQIQGMSKGASEQLQTTNKPSILGKRKLESVHVAIKRTRKALSDDTSSNRDETPTSAPPFEYGRGRPPLATVIVLFYIT